MNRATGLALFLSGGVLSALLALPLITPILPSPSQPRPMLLAPMMDLTPCLLSETESGPPLTAPQGLLKNCLGPQGSAADWVNATLSTLTPSATAQPNWSWGYTLKVPLLNFVQPGPSGWQVDTQALDKVVRTIEQTGKPLVLYLFSTHFSTGAPAEKALAQNSDNLSFTRDGPMAIDRYYGQPLYPWSVARLDNPITALREDVIRALNERLCARPESVRRHIQAITLLGEVHHLFPQFENGMGFASPYRVSDYSPASEAAFQRFLERRHGSLAQFNQSMGSAHARWQDVRPPSKDIRVEKLQHFHEHQDSFASGLLPLTGWVHAPESAQVAQVHVFINGRLRAKTPVRLDRQDVLAAKPEFGRANVGWRHDLDFSQWPPGIHRIDLGLSLGGDRLYHLSKRHVAIGDRQQSPLQAAPSVPAPAMAPLPASIQNYTDEPRDLASYYYNPLAREWLQFRQSQVQAYLQHFNQLFDSGCLAQTPRYTHQIVPHFNPGWDADKFAVRTSLQPQTQLQLGVSLYGETSDGPSFRGWLQQEKHRQYGITEFHPLRAMTAPELTTVLRQHHAAGAQFLSFFMDTPAHEQTGEGLNLFSFSPRNTQHASHVLFESLRQTLQNPPSPERGNGTAQPAD